MNRQSNHDAATQDKLTHALMHADKDAEEKYDGTVQILMEMTLKSKKKCLAALKRANGDSATAAGYLLGQLHVEFIYV